MDKLNLILAKLILRLGKYVARESQWPEKICSQESLLIIISRNYHRYFDTNKNSDGHTLDINGDTQSLPLNKDAKMKPTRPAS